MAGRVVPGVIFIKACLPIMYTFEARPTILCLTPRNWQIMYVERSMRSHFGLCTHGMCFEVGYNSYAKCFGEMLAY